MEDTITVPREAYEQMQATILAQADHIKESDRVAATLGRDARRLASAVEKSLDQKVASESSEASETRKRDAETLTTTHGIHNANKRVWLGKPPITCCAAQCEDEIKHKGELVSLPWCRHMMHVDCIMMMRSPHCPQCRKSVCATAEAHFKILNDNEIIQRENQRVEDELEARRIARAPPPQRAAPRVVSPEEQAAIEALFADPDDAPINAGI